ncbi:CinA family protein [Pontivivens insulae]|uniref:Nicotinamide-nucleotide amidohydrolase PncC n=2 Tax=Pontivivens insulae TaxID=1639689 RepID=A0A2R8ABF2_9RHOB|nr:CinA family protein [Pontivivens insulae]RED13288.1 nicotinamide-nucleotide amidase [Pontivivens insulae]SPF29380.1 Nicotinamide-nucleotide amidohydrolase PncC [Pontivivens insulae]
MSRAAEVLRLARAKGWMIATAESCTGGLVAAALTDVPGSSDVFDRGFLTYSYPAKVAMLGVRQDTLDAVGAVSEEVARQMAEGACEASDAVLSVAITGVAGPGASGSKPEGLVHFATTSPTGTVHSVKEFGPLGREAVRRASVDHALELLLDRLI